MTSGPASSSAERARAIEQQMIDEERFSLIWSVMGANDMLPGDARIPDGVPMGAGYTG